MVVIRKLIAAFLVICLACLLLTPAAAIGADELDALLEDVELVPIAPGSSDLDNYLEMLMPQIWEELADDDVEDLDTFLMELSTYDKLTACYDYIVDTVSYGSHTANLGTEMGSTTCRSIYNSYGAVEGFGAVALSANVGMCNAYASAFILMARKLGFEAELVKGSTQSRGGGYAYHEWAEVIIGDDAFVFDPQLDQSLMRQGLGSHVVFFKTYDQLPGRYNKY